MILVATANAEKGQAEVARLRKLTQEVVLRASFVDAVRDANTDDILVFVVKSDNVGEFLFNDTIMDICRDRGIDFEVIE